MSNDPGEVNAVGGRGYGAVGGTTSINIQGLTQATAQVASFNAAVAGMQQTLNKFTSQASSYAAAFNKITSAVSGASSGASAAGAGGGGLVSSMFGAANERGWVKDLMMFPTRFMRSAVTDNRNLAAMASGGLAQQAFGAGTSTTTMMGALAGQFGGVLGGNPADLVNLMNIASKVGAGVDWRSQYAGGYGPAGYNNAPRAGGFMKGVYEAQRMNPGADVGTLAGQVGMQGANVGAAQASAMLTGGAFSMIASGNRQKSISEWADGVLKWLQNLRPGNQRGKPFSYGELMSQNFPGSNIDAWLTANGISEDMKGYFWTYAMARSNQTGGGTADDLFKTNAALGSSVIFNKLQASAATTRTGFQLAGQMGGAYANKEQANTFFNELMGHMLNQVLPSAMSSGTLSFMQFMPDMMEEVMMQLAERTTLGTGAAGLMGWGAGLQNLMTGYGDVGDVGDYGPMGGTSTAGMHPDARKRVDAMMRDNPRIRMTSGYRDLGTQQRLKRKGVGRVSGKPSDHTRGFAADLGPADQYGWISRNAKRYGLKSGRSQGEPWHVGMGDVGDIDMDWLSKLPGISGGVSGILDQALGANVSGMFSKIFGGVFDSTNQMQGIGSASSILLQAIMGIFGGSKDASKLAYNPDVYSTMVSSALNANMSNLLGPSVGVSTGGGVWGNLLSKALSGGGAGAVTGGAGGGPQGFGGGGIDPGVWSGDNLTRGVAVVKLLKQAGFSGDELSRMAAISWHESGWKPGSWVADDDDIGGGLWAINQKPWIDKGMVPPYSMADIKDPWKSTQIAREYYLDRGYQPWTTRNKSLDMGIQAREAAGVGDMGYYDSPMDTTVAPGRSIMFNNTFQINGGGSSGGIDVRRTASLLADQLETQVKQRMARIN